MTGQKLITCPWRAFSDPVVLDVLEAKSLVGDGPIAALPLDSTPNRVIEGLLVYRRTTQAIHNHDMEQKRKESAKSHGKG